MTALGGTAEAAIVAAFLLGRHHVAEQAREAGALAALAGDASNALVDGVLGKGVGLESAALHLARLVSMPRDEFDDLSAVIRPRAFTVAGVTSTDLLRDVQAAITATVGTQAPDGDFAAQLREAFRSVGIGDPDSGIGSAWHVETVFRTNATAAYAAGRWSEIDALGSAVEHVEFVGVPDERQSSVCKGYNGLVASADDPVWVYATPPNHFACRSTVRPIFAGTAEAGRRARSTAAEIASMPDAESLGGFGGSVRTLDELAAVPPSVAARATEYGLDLASLLASA